MDNSCKTLCFNSIKSEQTNELHFVKIDFECLEEEILDYLFSLNLQSLIIEGGAKTIQKFIDKNFWMKHTYTLEIKNLLKALNALIFRFEPFQTYNLLGNKLKLYKNV